MHSNSEGDDRVSRADEPSRVSFVEGALCGTLGLSLCRESRLWDLIGAKGLDAKNGSYRGDLHSVYCHPQEGQRIEQHALGPWGCNSPLPCRTNATDACVP